jgi:hypothetical protein
MTQLFDGEDTKIKAFKPDPRIQADEKMFGNQFKIPCYEF